MSVGRVVVTAICAGAAQWLLQRSSSIARTLGEAAMPSSQQDEDPPAWAWLAEAIRRLATAAIKG